MPWSRVDGSQRSAAVGSQSRHAHRPTEDPNSLRSTRLAAGWHPLGIPGTCDTGRTPLSGAVALGAAASTGWHRAAARRLSGTGSPSAEITSNVPPPNVLVTLRIRIAVCQELWAADRKRVSADYRSAGKPVVAVLRWPIGAQIGAWYRGLTSWSDDHREMVEGCAQPVLGGDIGGEFIVTAAEVLDERVPGGQDPRGLVAFQAAHRPQPRLQPAMAGLDGVVRVALDGMQRRGDQLAQDPRTGRGTAGGDLGRDRARAQRPSEEPPGRGQSYAREVTRSSHRRPERLSASCRHAPGRG